jgi:hypothetical protein
LKRLCDPLAAYMANGFDRAPLPGPGDPERRTGERARAAADANGEAAAKASNPVRLAGVGLAARCTGELGTVLGGELGREEDMVNGGAAFKVVGGVAIVFVIVIVELFVRVDEEPKRLGPLTDAKGDSRDAYEAKPPPPCARID